MKKRIGFSLVATCLLGFASTAHAATTGTVGDVDRDGRVTNIDSMRLYRELEYPIGSGFDWSRADVNADLKVDVDDAAMIYQFSIGAIPELCDGIDNDGNGATDEGCAQAYHSVQHSTWIPTSTSELPTGFEGMEIEAKFDAKIDKMKQLHDYLDICAALPTSTGNTKLLSEMCKRSLFGSFKVEQRWKGRSKLFQDYYYDASNGQTPSGWVVRHRTRFYSNSPSSLTNAWDPNTFINDATQGKYDVAEEDFIQVKDAPTRYGEVWFRNEWGNDCIFLGSNPATCTGGLSPQGLLQTPQQWQVHSGLSQLLAVDNAPPPYQPVTFLQTFRQRWTLTESGASDPTYEISFDYVTEANWKCAQEKQTPEEQKNCVVISSVRNRGEIEVEVLPTSKKLEELQLLFQIGDFMQNGIDGGVYAIEGPSTTSKGGVLVTDSTPKG